MNHGMRKRDRNAKRYQGSTKTSKPELRPTHPRTSTREHAVVGVGGALRPMNDFVLPCERKVDTRGVDSDGKGTVAGLEVRVIVDGVRVERVGDGGNTKSV